MLESFRNRKNKFYKMNKILFFLIIIISIFIFTISRSQSIDSVVYQVNTVGKSTNGDLQFWIYLKLNQNEEFSLDNLDNTHEIEIRNKEDDKSIGKGVLPKQISSNNNYIVGNFELTKGLIKYLIDERSSYYLYSKEDIIIKIDNTIDSTKNREIVITPSVLKAATLDKLKFSKDYFDLLLKKYGDASFLYGNFIDAGTQVYTDDSSKSNYVFQFNYTTSLFYSRHFSVAASGRFSTKTNDPLSKFSIFPLYYNYLYFNEYVPLQATILSGIEANQNFTIQKFSAGGEVQAIIPNFIDFTGGENRIRLKPVFKLGMKWLKEYRTNDKYNQSDNDGQVFTELYYFIPVYKSYSLLLTGNAFNNFTGITSGNGWLYQYNLTLGVELPVTGLNVIAKYSQGSNDINYEYDSQLILGLIMDLFDK